MAGGSRIIRKFIRGKCPDDSLEIRAPQMFRPVCSLRGNARRRVRVGEKSFPGFNGQGFADKLRGTARR